MQLLKKLIILSGYQISGKGIIRIESFNGKTTAEIRIFEPNRISYRLGVRIGHSRLYEYNLDSKESNVHLEYTNLEERIDCVIVDNDTLEPLLYGSTIGSDIDITRTTEMFTKVSINIEPIEQEKSTDDIIQDTHNPNKKLDTMPEYVSEKNRKINSGKNTCEETVMLDSKKNLKDSIQEGDKERIQELKEQLEQDFFVEIKPQLDELFKCYPADKELMLSVPDSKWVRVNYEKNEYYVVGVLYNGKRATHICYGVPGHYNVRPKQKSEWLPLDYLDPEGKGYWVIFQDAITGKTLE